MTIANLSVADCLVVSLVGFLVVFGVLLALAGATKLMSKIITAMDKKPQKKEP